ncbi:hypothetical protein, partial [Rhodoferax sp.]|uniref:hypothetical protein n=1 Tax=Rhodoferax sp. TaxID=50421 RepID=UPI002ACE8098
CWLDRRPGGWPWLALLAEPALPEAAGGTRAVRGEGRKASQLRKFIAAKGFRQPEEVIAEMAGLDRRDALFEGAWADTERALVAAQDGATAYKGAPVAPSMRDRLETFKFFYSMRLRAAEALLPYGLGKVTPDVAQAAAVQIVMPGGQGVQQASPKGPDQARDVTPSARRMAPPPMPWQTQANQGLSDGDAAPIAADIRTDDAT